MKQLLLTLWIFVFVYSAQAQKYKFGKVSKAELSEKICPIDSTANACVLYKNRYTHFDYQRDEGFVIIDEYFVRIKIYNKEGFDVATRSIPLYYNPHDEEKVIGLKAVTYNLENGKIVKTKLSKNHIYVEKTTNHYKQYKFSMPNIKPGSVIEFKYSFHTPFITKMNRIVLQEDIPIKKEQVSVYVPEYFMYRPYIKGYLPVDIQHGEKNKTITMTKKTRTGTKGWSPRETHYAENSYTYKETTYDIEKENVPALKDEPYSGNIDNYKSAVEFELIYTDFPGELRKKYAVSWEDVVKDAYFDSDFGRQLNKQNYLKEVVAEFKDMPNNTDKLQAVFELAKQKIKWNHGYDYYVDKGVVKAFKTGTGNVADVNLNLINMLNASGFQAAPVLVSTVAHGIPLYPTRAGFNYVIATVQLNGTQYLLDATEKYSTLKVLPERVLNFEGRLVHKDGSSKPIALFPKAYSNKISQVNLKLEDDELSGMSITRSNDYFAFNIRKNVASKNEEEQEKWLQDKYKNLEILNFRIKNLENPYKQVSEAIQFTTDAYTEEISGQLFVSPLLDYAIESNPFKSPDRQFPVFYNYPYLRSVTVNFTVPEAYEVVKLPESAVFTFGDKDGGYEYKVEQKGNKIVIVSTYVINSPVIDFTKYKELKAFVDKVIAQQKEKIILKKK